MEHDSGIPSHLEIAFGIQLTDEEHRGCVTRDHAERTVLDKVSLGGPARALLPVARDRTRAALAATLGRDVPLAAKLEDAFPRFERRKHWRRFARELGVRLWSPRRPVWVPLVVLFVALVTGWLIFSGAEHLDQWSTWRIINGGAIAAGALAFLATRSVSLRFPYKSGDVDNRCPQSANLVACHI